MDYFQTKVWVVVVNVVVENVLVEFAFDKIFDKICSHTYASLKLKKLNKVESTNYFVIVGLLT